MFTFVADTLEYSHVQMHKIITICKNVVECYSCYDSDFW